MRTVQDAWPGACCKMGLLQNGIPDAMTDRIETLLDEQRSFPPPEHCRARAWVRDTAVYERARQNRESYWAD